MKPVVYFDFEDIGYGKVSIDKKRLKEILDEVYQTGYDDGIKNKTTITTTPWNYQDKIYCDNEQIIPDKLLL